MWLRYAVIFAILSTLFVENFSSDSGGCTVGGNVGHFKGACAVDYWRAKTRKRRAVQRPASRLRSRDHALKNFFNTLKQIKHNEA